MDKLLLDKPTYQALSISVEKLQKRLDLVYQLLEQEATTKEAPATDSKQNQNQENTNIDKTDVLNQVLQTVKQMTSSLSG